MVFNSTEHKRMSIFYMWLIFYGITAALNLTICLVFSHNSYYFNDSCYVWSLLTPFIYTFYPIVIIFNMLGINFGIWGTVLLYVLLFYLLSMHKVFSDMPQNTMYKMLKTISDVTRKYMVWQSKNFKFIQLIIIIWISTNPDSVNTLFRYISQAITGSYQRGQN